MCDVTYSMPRMYLSFQGASAADYRPGSQPAMRFQLHLVAVQLQTPVGAIPTRLVQSSN